MRHGGAPWPSNPTDPRLPRNAILPSLVLALAAAHAACGDAPARVESVLLATTTSVEDTGLLDALAAGLASDLPRWRVRVIAVGTGEALELARRGDADVVLVHDPAAEQAFIAAGHGDRRRTIMRNDFVVVGPPDDPAGIREASDTPDAFARIARTGSLFLSRGDSSGTHRREVSLWREAGLAPAGQWYLEAGLGQGDLLRMASERGAYALVDRGTFRYHAPRLALSVLHADQPPLDNPYSVIVARRAADPEGAHAVADWLAGARARAIIAGYGRETFGTPLFEAL